MKVLYLIISVLIVSSVVENTTISIPGSNIHNASNHGSLQYYLCGNGSHYIKSDMTLSLSSSIHIITSGPFCLLQHLMNIVITTSDSNPAHIICDNVTQPTRGFGFLNTTGLSLRNLHIEHCGGILTPTAVSSINKSRVYFLMGQTAVLLIGQSLDITLSNLTINGGYFGYAMIIVNIYGIVHMTDISVSNSFNCLSEEQDSQDIICSGSGLLFLFMDTHSTSNNSVLVLQNVTLNHNINHYTSASAGNPIDLLQYGVDSVPIFGAGGLTILFIGNGYQYGQVVMEYCEVSDTRGSFVGGILITYIDTTGFHLPSFDVKKTFSCYNNQALSSGGKGGCLSIEVIKTTYERSILNITLDGQVTFFHNSNVDYGGGVYVSVPSLNSLATNITISGVTFQNNTAVIGGNALYIKTQGENTAKIRSDTYVGIINGDVYRNGKEGKGAIIERLSLYVQSIIEFVGNLSVLVKGGYYVHNFGSVIVATRSYITVSGDVHFIRNRGKTGTCFLLTKGSVLNIQAPSNISFDRNYVFLSSGLIVLLGFSRGSYNSCPLQFLTSKKQNSIILNVHEQGYYIGNCFIYSDAFGTKCNKTYFTKYIHQSGNSSLLLSSPPTALYRCENMTRLYSTNISVYPGQKFPSFVAHNFENKSVLTRVYVDLYHGTNQLVSSSVQLLEDKCTSFDARFSHYTSTGTLIISNPEYQLSLRINVAERPCPVGFVLSDMNGACVCDKRLISYKITNCNIDTTSITIPNTTWLGKVVVDKNTSTLLPFAPDINGTFGFAPVCPTGYCKPGITEVNMIEQDSLCQHHRTGVLCGGCEDGYSLVLGPDECQICNSNLWLLMVLVFAVAGIAMVIVLFCLRMTISNQLLGGVIFYVNMTEVSLRTVILHQHTYGFILNIIFSLLNLELGFSVCLYNGLNALIKTALQFIFPVYLWLIVLMLVIISKRSSYVANLTIHSSIQVLATLFYLSFAKLLLTAIDIFIPVNVQTPHGEFTVWYVDGNIPYWRNSGHVALFITAIITSIFYLLPFLLWTTCGSLLARRLRWIKKRRNLIDAYQGQYRDGWGWWFGARLWLLVCSHISYALLRGNDPSLLLLLHLVFLAPFTFIQVYYKPYRGKWVNIFECVILIDLLLLEFITLYGQLKGDVSITQPYISVLMLLVLLILISLMGWHCMGYMTRYKVGRMIRKSLKKKKATLVSKFQKDQECKHLFESLTDDD